jgi:hypothetical protein
MRPAVLILLTLCLPIACGKGTSSSEIEQVAKETLAATRSPQVVRIQVRLEKTEAPTPADLAVRQQIEERIEQERVGTITSTTTDLGHYDLALRVESTADAVPKVRAILNDAGVLERATVRVGG